MIHESNISAASRARVRELLREARLERQQAAAGLAFVPAGAGRGSVGWGPIDGRFARTILRRLQLRAGQVAVGPTLDAIASTARALLRYAVPTPRPSRRALIARAAALLHAIEANAPPVMTVEPARGA